MAYSARVVLQRIPWVGVTFVLAAALVALLLRPSVLVVMDVPHPDAVVGPGVVVGAGLGFGLVVGEGPLPVLRPGPYAFLAPGLPSWVALDVGGWGYYPSPAWLLGLAVGLVGGVLLWRSVAFSAGFVVLVGIVLASPAVVLLAAPLSVGRSSSSRWRVVLAAPLLILSAHPWGPVVLQVLIAGLSVAMVVAATSRLPAHASLLVVPLAVLGAFAASAGSGAPSPEEGDLVVCISEADSFAGQYRCAEGIMWFWGMGRPYEEGKAELASYAAGWGVTPECQAGEEALYEATYGCHSRFGEPM